MPIRPANADDLPTIERIVAAAYSKYILRIGKPPGPMLDDYAAHIRAHTIWITDDNSGIIVLLPEPDHLLLENIAVDPAHHGKGIGRALMEFADAEASRRAYPEIRLYTHETMTENIALYHRTGWEETGRSTQDGYNRVFFRKTVP